MKKNIEIETYRFVGDSKENTAKLITKGEPVKDYSQTSIIKALNENKQYVVSGTKLKSSIDNPRQAYLIEYGTDKENVEQIIKIVIDKEVLLSGDPNALAIENLCKQSINVKIKNTAVKVLAVATVAITAVGLTGAFIAASNMDAKDNELKMSSYTQEVQQEQNLNGGITLGDSTISVDFSEEFGRSR